MKFLSSEKNMKSQEGFTLIELMVSVAIFSIVLLFALGSIITIVDANRKARTLTSVMNNVNFAFENMTRSIKTGRNAAFGTQSGTCAGTGSIPAGSSIRVAAVDPTADPDTFTRATTTYRLCVKDDFGFIEKDVDGGGWEQITSSEVDIDTLEFKVYADGLQLGAGSSASGGEQPRVFTTISGNVEYVRNVRSEFNIQTTVSQRDLNLP